MRVTSTSINWRVAPPVPALMAGPAAASSRSAAISWSPPTPSTHSRRPQRSDTSLVTTVPVFGWSFADSHHLPQGRRQAVDDHLRFHETWDNLDRLVGWHHSRSVPAGRLRRRLPHTTGDTVSGPTASAYSTRHTPGDASVQRVHDPPALHRPRKCAAASRPISILQASPRVPP